MRFLSCCILGLCFLAGCRSYSYIDDYQLTPNRSRLPKLAAITDQEIFNSDKDDYSGSYSRSIGSSANLYLIERQFNKYIIDHLTSPRTKKKGYAVMRINHLQVRNHLPLLSVAAIVSVGLTTVVGIPAGQYHIEIDMSMEVLDNNQNIIGTYRAQAQEKAWIALYYGYGENEAKEKCLYEAVEKCLNEVNDKVMRDFDYLEKKLVD